MGHRGDRTGHAGVTRRGRFNRNATAGRAAPRYTSVVDETPLPGGRTVGAVRIGDTVHRAAQPWTPAVHLVLRYLEDIGFEGAPRVVGFDGSGREVLTYLPGETVGGGLPWPDWVYSEEALRQVGAWMRRLHDATAAFVPPEGVRWFAGQTWQPGLIIGHHDAAPYNAVWHDGELVGFVDWDTTGPSSPELDLAFLALAWVPLLTRRIADEQGFAPSLNRSRRLRLLLDAYGYHGDRSVFGVAVARRARLTADGIRHLASDGDPTYVALLPAADGFEQTAAEVEALPASFWSPAEPA